MAYKQVSFGSQGSDVKTLQKMLNGNGYNLDVDGIFGSKTQSAVKDYQNKNKLAVDGIVGTNTWGALTKASTQPKTTTTAKATTNTTKAKTTTPTFQHQPYKESDVVLQAQKMLQQQMAQKPGAYQSQWQAQLDEAMKKILNREKFSYDLNGDALYQQYKDQHMLQGQQAMMDTMGQAQAMTGGYGNSYAQSVGQQVYQGHLQQLNDRIPELYQLALNKYQMEGDEMAQQLAILAQQEEQDYGRYRDDVGDWQTGMDRALDQYYTERDFDYGKWADNRDFGYGQYIDDRNYQYQVDRDAVSDQQWLDSFDYQKNRDKVSDSQWQKEFDEAVRQYNHKNGISTGSTGGNTGGGNTTTETPSTNPTPSPKPNPGYNNSGLSSEEIKAIQKTLGVTADGKWGPESQAAAKAMWGVTSAKDAQTKNSSMKQNTGSSFTGSTYNEAVAYLKNNGVPSDKASSIYTASEWQRRKNSGGGSDAVKEFKTYAEYLEYAVDAYKDAYGK